MQAGSELLLGLVASLTLAWILYRNLAHGVCRLCHKNRKRKHLAWHYIVGDNCKPNCLTVDFLSAPAAKAMRGEW